jgi:DnaJ-class molecular chaperone
LEYLLQDKKTGECPHERREDKRMSATEQFYQILKLKLGTTEKQIKQAYENLINMWHPEELSKYPYLQRIAYERKKQIELAYENLVGELVKKK